MTIKNSQSIPADYKSLVESAYSNPFDRQIVDSFFEEYEKLNDCEHINQVGFLQLKFLHADQKWKYLNKIADLYLKEGQQSLAYICLLESLRLNADQEKVFKLTQSLQEYAKPIFPKGLKKNRCLVSVIMATCNRTEEIRESIESFLVQTLKEAELIVINDGGTDKVKEIIESYDSPKIKYYKFPENRGLAAALNEGVRQAEGKYIAYLDDDDVYYPNHLATLVDTLEASGYKLAYSNNQKVECITEHVTIYVYKRSMFLLNSWSLIWTVRDRLYRPLSIMPSTF